MTVTAISSRRTNLNTRASKRPALRLMVAQVRALKKMITSVRVLVSTLALVLPLWPIIRPIRISSDSMAKMNLIVKFPLNPILSFVPELNFGMTYLSEEIKGAGGHDYFWGEYKVNDAKTLYSLNIPLMLRLQVPYVYVEGGVRLNLNLDTSHEYEYTDEEGNALRYYDYDDGEEKTVKRDAEDEWKVKTFIPSIVAGLGTTFLASGLQCDLGLRFIWDLRGIEENDKEIYALEDKKLRIARVVENESSLFAIQLVLNVFF